MTDTATDRIEYTTKETGAEIRRALRAAFPGTRFSLTMSRGTGHGYFNLTWTDGPTEAQVSAVCDYFDSEGFDGMTDSSYAIPPKLVSVPDREMPVVIAYSCKGVLTQRRFSPEVQAWADEQARLCGLPADSYGHLAYRMVAAVDLTPGIPKHRAPERAV